MTRLPIPGSDDGTWGQLLNDFLSVEHNNDGTLKANGSLASKADDSVVVHNSGNESIDGTKTFTSSPLIPTPTSASQAATKAYVDSTATGAPSATTASEGIVQLAGDLTGTATAPLVAAGAITGAKIANTTITDTNISSISESKITNLTSDLASKVPTSRVIATGTGLTGGGDLTADRTLTVTYGVIAGTSAQGNDARITGAEQTSNKNVANGYAPLDGTGKVPAANLPAAATGSPSDPSILGLALWTTPMFAATLTYGPGAQSLVAVLVRASTAATLTKLGTWITTAGSSAGIGVNGIGLYSEAGTQLAITGDMTTQFQTTGFVEGTLTSSYTIAAGTNYYLAFLNNFSTAPILATNGSAGTYPSVRGHYPSVVAFSQLSFPASFTPSSLTPGNLPIFLTAGT
jgi:hypothetical protein